MLIQISKINARKSKPPERWATKRKTNNKNTKKMNTKTSTQKMFSYGVNGDSSYAFYPHILRFHQVFGVYYKYHIWNLWYFIVFFSYELLSIVIIKLILLGNYWNFYEFFIMNWGQWILMGVPYRSSCSIFKYNYKKELLTIIKPYQTIYQIYIHNN